MSAVAKATPAVARYAAALRYELSVRNEAYAKTHQLKHQASYGSQPVICYEPDGQCHGNFLPPTYRAILANPLWARRLLKAHTSARTALPRNDRGFWCELDSCNSSDALLMNVFCYPGVFDDGRVISLLGLESGAVSEFGFKARVPLKEGTFDRTEVDMRLGSLLLEAKLTEGDFQTREKELVESYRDLASVFDRKALPKIMSRAHVARISDPCTRVEDAGHTRYVSYQLIRNVLAAVAHDCAFCVLCDKRRPDLLQAWYEIMRCVRPVDLRVRCKILTWQELAAVLPSALQEFLDEKYGIGRHL
ncbi:MAG: PGN_0703 family putative restriction endonuclease [Terriglobales bacterium]